MRGEYQLTVRTNKVQVKLTIRRNLTIIQGKSATGKTTLLDSLRAYENLGAQSGITVNCAAPAESSAALIGKRNSVASTTVLVLWTIHKNS